MQRSFYPEDGEWENGMMVLYRMLANDVVYSVAVDGPYVWAATASGANCSARPTRA